jgi:hypothetical protein
MGPFTLVKWYMDCVTDAGDAAIVYCADLRWRGLHASMGSVLESRAGRESKTRTSLGRFRIRATADEIVLEHPRLEVAGSWQSACPPVERTVYEEAEGSIVWNCLQPGSRVTMRVGDINFIGMGYAERLTLTLPSWRLPIRHLRWGRFVSVDHSLTWVDWQGPHSTRFAVCDGREQGLVSATESEVVIDNASLEIAPGDALRSGQLSSTILAGAPALMNLFPASLFNIREQKWKSRGTLVDRGGTSHGWVIHEVVDWEL